MLNISDEIKKLQLNPPTSKDDMLEGLGCIIERTNASILDLDYFPDSLFKVVIRAPLTNGWVYEVRREKDHWRAISMTTLGDYGRVVYDGKPTSDFFGALSELYKEISLDWNKKAGRVGGMADS